MEILKIATEWAKAEVFSSKFFILFGFFFVAATLGFWQLGKTETARAYIYPTLVAGIFLLAVGIGILFANKSRISSFELSYKNDEAAFITSEIARTEKIIGEYSTIALKVIPLIVAVAAILIVFINTPLWRAICITTVAMMAVILLIDSNAKTRVEEYHKQLQTKV